MNHIETMKQALDALDSLTDKVDGTGFSESDEFSNALDVIDILRAAIAQPTDYAIHKAHCFQAPYETSCKYGDVDCPMAGLMQPDAAAYFRNDGSNLMTPKIAQPESEPVAWYDPKDFTRTTSSPTDKETVPLYAVPQVAYVPLTIGQIEEVLKSHYPVNGYRDHIALVCDVERAVRGAS